MNQTERRLYLIQYLLDESPQYKEIKISHSSENQKKLLRALFNVRLPKPIDDDFLKVQDIYLQKEIAKKGITDYKTLDYIKKDIYLWQGDITTLKCDVIVNAANNQMLGCFFPNHNCIDNAIHTYAGIELRLECANLMKKQNGLEKAGGAKITSAYNLPCHYIIHTVGPVIYEKVRKEDEEALASCYKSCLELANKKELKSIAFCSISTGEFHFPIRQAAKIAIKTVLDYKEKTNSKIQVIFNVFKEEDYGVYKKLLR